MSEKKKEPALLKAKAAAVKEVLKFEKVVLRLKKQQAEIDAKLPGMLAAYRKLEMKIKARRESIAKLEKELAKRYAKKLKIAKEVKDHDNAKTSILKRNPTLQARISADQKKAKKL